MKQGNKLYIAPYIDHKKTLNISNNYIHIFGLKIQQIIYFHRYIKAIKSN